MTMTPALAAELALLSQTLNLPGTDIADTLTTLVADVQTAIDSYLGLSIAISTGGGSPATLTVLEDTTRPDDVRASLLIPLAGAADDVSPPTSVALILFAGVPGAFTDLAADLAWITGRPLPEYLLDEHRHLPLHDSGPTLSDTTWTIHQAHGVLIARGATLEQAERQLHQQAATAGTDLQQAAALILADLTPHDPEPNPS